MDLTHKKSKSENNSMLPELDKWLETANDYEKEVVHKFVSNVVNSKDDYNQSLLNSINKTGQSFSRLSSRGSMSKTNNNRYSELPFRPNSSNNIVTLDPNIDIKKSVRIRSAPIIGYEEPSYRKSATPEKQHKTVEAETGEENPRIVSPASSRGSSSRSNSSRSSSAGSLPLKNVTTQIPYKFGSKPSSPLYKDGLSKSTPDRIHKCKTCQTCREKEVKNILEELKGSWNNQTGREKDFKKMLEELKGASTKSYEKLRQERPNYVEEDYHYTGNSFQHVNGVRKNFFIIHPDFVSENKGRRLLEKRKLAKKYFGESKPAC